MIALLKADDDRTMAAVRPFANRTDPGSAIPVEPRRAETSDAPPGYSRSPATPVADPRIGQLERQVEELGAQLTEAALAAEAREAEAYARGEHAGRSRAEGFAQEHLAAFQAALSSAQALHEKRLETLEVLALEVAQAVLSRILGDGSHYARTVADSVCQQMAQIDRALVTRVRISPDDFADEQALADLATRAPAIPLLRDPALASGDCRIDLVLGSIEAGVPGQWARAVELLESMTETEGMA
jgi:flagellar biosynthesis/type III secretory pathway protein FliH